MATITAEIVVVLRNTARQLTNTRSYQWGHMGSCNCGFLAQEISRLHPGKIHAAAMEKCGDWSEQLLDYCPASGQKIDEIITLMIRFGFSRKDLTHLERLSDPQVLQTVSREKRILRHNFKPDVIY
jgi:hypothetical protein